LSALAWRLDRRQSPPARSGRCDGHRPHQPSPLPALLYQMATGAVAKGRRKDSVRAFAKLAVAKDGDARIRADPPLIVPIADLVDRSGAFRLELGARRMLESYLGSLPGDRPRLLERFR